MQRYNPKDIEPKWQQAWEDQGIYHVSEDTNKPKSYVTAMFPYPSGAGLHVGHVRNYSITDAIARYQRLNGKNVLTTIGWDAFGLPAENYAIKTGTPPAISTKQNIENFKGQLKRLGMSYDWRREINTSDPSYYRWTQWIFTKLFERGLAYQKESLQWWCPICKTVLANEQVINGGFCWRHEDTPVEKRWTKQWFFKITEYADQLLEGIDDLEWPEKIKTMQRNWIGRSVGAEIVFKIADRGESLKVFTTRPDTLYGATFMVLAPEHPSVEAIVSAEQQAAVHEYVEETQKKSDIERTNDTREKTGVFTGAYAINPINDERIPIWIADYVLPGYGTGAIMAVPGHDQRDADFAAKYNIPLRVVIEPTYGAPVGDETHKKSVFVIVHDPKTDKVIVLDWGPREARHGGKMLIGGGVEGDEAFTAAAEREIQEETGYKNFKLIRESDFNGHGYFYSNTKNKNMHVTGKGLLYELVDDEQTETNLDDGERDKFTVTWEPVEKVASLLDDGVHEALYRHLMLGESYHGEGVMINSGEFDGMPSSDAREAIVAKLSEEKIGEDKVNYRMRDWLVSRQRYWGAPIPIIHCTQHGAVAVPEDQLPVLLPEIENYEPSGDGKGVLGKAKDWVETTCPKCGEPAERETDTMDGYACSSWYYLRYTDADNSKQAWDPAKANYWLPIDYYCGGDHAVSHLLYSRFWMHVFADMGLIEHSRKEPVHKLVYNGYINAADGAKMSKSKGNVVDPNELIDQGYGADAMRLYELFIAPYDYDATWDPSGIAGTYRFLNRVWTLVQEYTASEAVSTQDEQVTRSLHKAIRKVTEDMERLSFNTAIAALMELTNELYKLKLDGMKSDAWLHAVRALLQLLAPFSPHITEELWQQLDGASSIHQSSWPSWDETYLVQDMVTIAIQVNGKIRGEIHVAAGASQQQVVETAQSNEKVIGHIGSKEIKKIIYVPGRLVSFVI